MLEARCSQCGETVIPESPEDRWHDGGEQECGGLLIVEGFWHPSMGIDPPAPPSLRLVDG